MYFEGKLALIMEIEMMNKDDECKRLKVLD
jgi:hypothetical protein